MQHARTRILTVNTIRTLSSFTDRKTALLVVEGSWEGQYSGDGVKGWAAKVRRRQFRHRCKPHNL